MAPDEPVHVRPPSPCRPTDERANPGGSSERGDAVGGTGIALQPSSRIPRLRSHLMLAHHVDASAMISATTETLAERERLLDRREEQQSKRHNARLAALAVREEAVEKRQRQQSQRERECAEKLRKENLQREKNLVLREKDLASRVKEIAKREKAAARSLDEIAESERRLEQRQKAVAQREAEVSGGVQADGRREAKAQGPGPTTQHGGGGRRRECTLTKGAVPCAAGGCAPTQESARSIETVGEDDETVESSIARLCAEVGIPLPVAVRAEIFAEGAEESAAALSAMQPPLIHSHEVGQEGAEERSLEGEGVQPLPSLVKSRDWQAELDHLVWTASVSDDAVQHAAAATTAAAVAAAGAGPGGVDAHVHALAEAGAHAHGGMVAEQRAASRAVAAQRCPRALLAQTYPWPKAVRSGARQANGAKRNASVQVAEGQKEKRVDSARDQLHVQIGHETLRLAEWLAARDALACGL